MRRRCQMLFLMLSCLLFFTGCGGEQKETKMVMKVAHFPNITHAQALIGLADGTFQKALGDEVKIESHCFNAGPEEIEALLAGEVDLGYIGPVPAINGYIKSGGDLQIIAGAADAGAVLVVGNEQIKTVRDLAGKKIAVPQFGNTQDISLRKLLAEANLKSVDQGGTVTVLQIKNPDILALFTRKQLDAALVPEPWGAKLEVETKAKVLLNAHQIWRDGDYSTAVVIVRKAFLQAHPELVERWLEAHVTITQNIQQDKEKTIVLLNQELKRLSGKSLPQAVLLKAFERIKITYDPEVDAIKQFADLSYQTGYLKTAPNIDGIFGLQSLNHILAEKKLPLVQ